MSKVLVLNAGSSSLKYQVIDMKTNEALVKGLCERIGIEGGVITHKYNGKKVVTNLEMKDHTAALEFVLKSIVDKEIGCVSSLDEISAVGHRVLHGGETFTKAVKIDDKVTAQIEELIPLGPLHQPANLQGIYACKKLMPKVPQVAVFDTAFHSTMKAKAFRYAIPNEDYTEYHIRKYGFHGTSHKFVSEQMAKYFGNKGKFIILHIGNGASISAVKNGVCEDTSMGYTPLDGCLMGTRSGSVDASILPTLCEKHGFDVNGAVNYLNKKSGLFGLTGFSDGRDVENASKNANGEFSAEQVANARLAEDMRAYIDAKIVASYVVPLGGVDAIAFTAGVGENDYLYRQRVVNYLEAFGIEIDENKNSKRGVEGEISTEDSDVKVYVIPTNEELQIAKESVEVLEL